jgi:predicted SnoaL-like aldol condensation-catalyzing enzyme
MTTNPTERTQSEINKTIVANYYARIWNAKNASAISDYVAFDYIQHNPHVPNGRAPLESFLSGFFQQMPQASFTVVRLVAEGDLVVAHCLFKANEADRGTAVVDVYRVADGMLVEHWDVKEAVPETSANGNPMV